MEFNGIPPPVGHHDAAFEDSPTTGSGCEEIEKCRNIYSLLLEWLMAVDMEARCFWRSNETTRKGHRNLEDVHGMHN